MAFAIAVIAKAAGAALLGPIFAAVWMAGWSYAAFRVATWRCPRCGEHYFIRGLRQNIFGQRCRHCGLPKWSLNETQP
jgi:hypothetical protein